MKIDVKKVKIFVTIPFGHVEQVRNAVCESGAGVIGNYTCCSYSVKGVGTFQPNDKANPYVGTKNNLEYVDEEKLEFICDVDNVKNVVTKLREVHPYEEPEIDIVPLLLETDFN